MNGPITSPSITFFELYKDNILKSRETLFIELNKISPEFEREARIILEEKIKLNNNPLMGELFPWIIKDLIGGDNLVTHKISVGWLAVYLYTLFLDEYVDNPKPLSPTKFITGSLLAKTGLLKIAHFTSNTPYEPLINNALSYSAVNQQFDVTFQKDFKELDIKEKYSEGKNYIVLACAGALAAQNSKHSEFIIQFTKKLLLTFQYLDDLGDYYEDYRSNNYTVLLNDAFSDSLNLLQIEKTYSKLEILDKLLESGALQRVIEKIIYFINQSISLIDENYLTEPMIEKSSVTFFKDLKLQCEILNDYLIHQQDAFKLLPKYQKTIILDKVEKHLIIIAEGT